jgi:hypothetical protein
MRPMATKMKLSLSTMRSFLTVLAFVAGTGLVAFAQDSSAPSLGDVARKTRQENSAPGHVAGKQLANEENDGPDTTGVWRVRLCTNAPCYELSVTLPKEAKWTRAKDEPRPVLIPLPGQKPDPSRDIRLYAAELSGSFNSLPSPLNPTLDSAKRLFLQSWFSRPEYFGHAARITLDEHALTETGSVVISQFIVEGADTKYRGLGLVAASPNGNYGFACVYREEDTNAAGSVCDAIIRSAHSQALTPAQQQPIWPYQPTQYYPYYPRIDDHAPDPPQNYAPQY